MIKTVLPTVDLNDPNLLRNLPTDLNTANLPLDLSKYDHTDAKVGKKKTIGIIKPTLVALHLPTRAVFCAQPVML